MPGGEVSEAIGDDAREDDVGGPPDPGGADVPHGADPGGARAPRRWLRALAIIALLALAAVPVGLQLQAASARGEARRSEAVQRRAERDEQSARTRLASVDSRVATARANEQDARTELARAWTAMTATGLEETLLDEVRRDTARHVKDLRRQNRTVARAISEQERLQPTAGDCLFDLLRALGRVGAEGHGGSPTPACTAVADRSPGPG